ncbi:MAG TPA: hypothetical protein VNX21_04260 [Candidatus Thermoplasmatota archaeon]|nr:hypothetical protein [Candidatus Thermoplasmatota archaeon]
MLRIVLLAALLLGATVVALPAASAEIDLKQLCEGLGPCRPSTFGCWITDFVPPGIECRM